MKNFNLVLVCLFKTIRNIAKFLFKTLIRSGKLSKVSTSYNVMDVCWVLCTNLSACERDFFSLKYFESDV